MSDVQEVITDPVTVAQATERLVAETIGCRLRKRRLGVRRAFSDEQIQQIASWFGADENFVLGGKKLVDTHHPKYRSVTRILSHATTVWKNFTYPYPDPGVRLLYRNRLTAFNERVVALQADLETAVADLESQYAALLEDSRARLGSLFNAGDYPPTLAAVFAIRVEYPNLNPPIFLLHENPELYRDAHRRMVAQLEQTIATTEAEFVSQFTSLVEHLCEKLKPNADGTKKRFYESNVNKLVTFFHRFRSLNLGCNTELTRIVAQAEAALETTDVRRLQRNQPSRDLLAVAVEDVRAQFGGLLAQMPERAIQLFDDDEEEENGA